LIMSGPEFISRIYTSWGGLIDDWSILVHFWEKMIITTTRSEILYQFYECWSLTIRFYTDFIPDYISHGRRCISVLWTLNWLIVILFIQNVKFLSFLFFRLGESLSDLFVSRYLSDDVIDFCPNKNCNIYTLLQQNFSLNFILKR
jgi:hypothetical protein